MPVTRGRAISSGTATASDPPTSATTTQRNMIGNNRLLMGYSAAGRAIL